MRNTVKETTETPKDQATVEDQATVKEVIDASKFLARTAEINDSNTFLALTRKIDQKLSSTNAQVAVNGGMFKPHSNTETFNEPGNTPSLTN